MSATRTGIDAVVLVIASTAAIANALAFVVNLGRIDASPFYVLLATLQAGLIVFNWSIARRAWRRIREARFAARMHVRIVRGDVVLHCRLCFVGLDEDGLDTWVIVAPDVLPSDRLEVGMLPPRTSIVWECPS